MYKLLLVDDEQIVRRNIIKKIDWERYGFSIAGEAENGREALEIIEVTNLDVIITDIEMPLMNGLELSKIIREKYPLIKIVLLTGFDEFKYAQQAINLNVMEYILKPISAESLGKVLVKLKNQIDKQISDMEDIKVLKEHYFASLPVMKINFFNTLIRNKLSEEEVLSKADYLGMELREKQFAAVVVNICKRSMCLGTFSKEDDELVRFAVQNTAEEIITRRNLGFVFLHDNYVIILCSSTVKNKRMFFNEIFNALEEIRQSIEKFIKLLVVFGVGKICTSAEHIKESFSSALAALDYRFADTNNRVIYIEDLEPHIGHKISFDEAKERTLISNLKIGTENQICETIDMLFKEIADIKASLNECQIYLMEILSTIIKTANMLEIDINVVFGNNPKLFDEILRFDNIDEVKEWFKAICVKMLNQIAKKRQSSCSALVDKAKKYINDNYGDSELSLNSVSNYLHISPSYFGAIFKNELGETFVNFLLKIRMEKARDLLSTTAMKSFEIAEKVGYSQQHYFSYSFKKHYGVSPNEFRNNLNKK